MDKETKNQIERGKRLIEILKQDQFKPLSLAQQVAIIYAATNGYLDSIDLDRIKEFETKLEDCIDNRDKTYLNNFNESLDLTEKVEESLKSVIEKVKRSF
jgi:F-type H+-transporting ATPase subunit alpha